MIAASVKTFVVSWKEAADRNDSVIKEAFVIPKSIGEYVDRSARKRATARTCYTRSAGLFLPQFGPLWEPALKEDYDSALSYTPYSEDLFSEPETASAYAAQLLSFVRETPKGKGR